MTTGSEAVDQEEQKRIEDEAFEAEMGEGLVDAEAPITKTEPDASTVETNAPINQEAKGEVERVEVIPGFTQAEIDELKESRNTIQKLQKALDTTNGTYGSKIATLERMIQSLQAQNARATAPITADSFKELRAEYPEIAEKIASGMREVFPVGQAPQEELTKLREEFDSKLAQKEQEEKERSIKRLAKAHPDFKEIASFQPSNGLIQWTDRNFGNWVAQQPEEVFQAVMNSKDADDLSEIITAYKSTLTQPKQLEQKRQLTNLEKAILPKGNATTGRTLTDKEIEEAAFKAEMAKDT